MKNDNQCSGCSHKGSCRLIYEKLTKAKGPNVAPKVIVAFLVPIAVFILALSGAEKLLKNYIDGKLLVGVSFLSAFLITFLVVVLIRAIRGPKNKEHCNKR